MFQLNPATAAPVFVPNIADVVFIISGFRLCWLLGGSPDGKSRCASPEVNVLLQSAVHVLGHARNP